MMGHAEQIAGMKRGAKPLRFKTDRELADHWRRQAQDLARALQYILESPKSKTAKIVKAALNDYQQAKQ